MKILFVVDDFSGGAGNVIQILANEFSHRGNSVSVMLFNKHTDSHRLKQGIDIIDCKINKCSTNKIAWFKNTLRIISKSIKELEPSVVISFINNNNTLVGLSMLTSKIPIIVCERSNPLAIKPNGFLRYFRMFAYMRANAITVQCSEFVKFSRLLKKKIYVTPNPIVAPTMLKNITALSKGEIRIVSCGRLAWIKRFDLMIYAFEKIHKEFPNTVLYIYGDGSERSNLEELINRLKLTGSVVLAGHTKDIYNVLLQSDIYLMTSEQEGFPNALSEAMAIGLPCVAVECHVGLRDLVCDGVNGYLVPNENNINLIAERACSIIRDEKIRHDFSTNAVLVAEKFSINSVCDIWEKLIKKVINKEII